MSSWRTSTLEELGSPSRYGFSTGPFGSSISKKFFVEEGVPVIRGSNLSRDVGVTLDDTDLAFIEEEQAAKFERSIARRGDLVFTCWGTVGQVGWVSGSSRFEQYVVSNKQMKMTVDPASADSRFLYYLLSSPQMVSEVTSQAIGTSVPGFNLGQLKALVVRVPPVALQRRIAQTLASFDDLIENNRRRIEILEEMARLLYREWFVHFRFPGHEDRDLVDSELGGLVPKGWRVVDFSECCAQLQAGGTPRRNDAALWDSHDLDWFKTGELQDDFLFQSEEGISELAAKSARTFERGTILMAIYGSPTVGRLGVLTRAATCNQAALAIVAAPGVATQTFLYYKLWELRSMFNSIAQGAAQQNISKQKVATARIALPPVPMLDAFDDEVRPLWELRENLNRQNRVLREARDLLLPRLVSGELDVSELDLDGLLA